MGGDFFLLRLAARWARRRKELFFFASVDILLEFFERKVNDVVMMEFFRLD